MSIDISSSDVSESPTASQEEACVDAKDVQDALAGVAGAYDRLVARHEKKVFAIAYRSLRNRENARDVTQQTFLQGFRKLQNLRDPSHFLGWLCVIARRYTINFAVRSPRHTSLGRDVPMTTEESILDLIKVERAELVQDVVERLREIDKEVLTGFYLEGLSLLELAVVIKVPVGTVKRRLHDARQRFREEFTAALVSEEDFFSDTQSSSF